MKMDWIDWLATVSILTLLGMGIYVLSTAPKEEPPVTVQEKTMYMELCADEGVSAFQCYDNWLRIKYNGN